MSRVERTTDYQFIPAQAGWSLIDFIYSEDGERYDAVTREPLIAWRTSVVKETAFNSHVGREKTETYTDVDPVTAEGVRDGDCYLQRPNGSLFSPHVGEFASEAELLIAANEDLKLTRERATRARTNG